MYLWGLQYAVVNKLYIVVVVVVVVVDLPSVMANRKEWGQIQYILTFFYRNKYFVCFYEFFQIHYQYLSSLSFGNKKLLNFRYLV